MPNEIDLVVERVEDLEDKVDGHEIRIAKNETTLAAHALLHTQHAMMITAAQTIALEAMDKTNAARAANDTMIKDALDKIAAEGTIRSEGIQSLRGAVSALQSNNVLQNNALATIVTQGKSTKGAVDSLAGVITAWHKHPAFKISLYVGTAIWGAITAYLAAHSK